MTFPLVAPLSPSRWHERDLRGVVEATAALEERVGRLSDASLAATRGDLSAQIHDGRPIEELAPEAFARAREAARRSLGLRPYDVQVYSAAAISRGAVAEARTGEGKTLASALALALNALAHPNVHAVTANPYLAGRDAEWMGPLYRALGFSVGVTRPEDAGKVKLRQAAYAADITYATASELGFDYLRDNMAHSTAGQVQRGHGFCLIDEVDAVLIDEARTPLIISGPADDHSEDYRRFAELVSRLRPADYAVDEALRSVTPMEGALVACEQMLGEDLNLPGNVGLVNHLVQALRAATLYQRDRHYLVRDGEVVLIDEPTGRVVSGRQWSRGLYQAVQAKEGLEITPQAVTLASITVQNYFRLYARLGGTSGTAASDRDEILSTYGMEVHPVPPHRPVARRDEPDLIYRDQEARLAAVVAETGRRHSTGQPVLIGTPTVEMSEGVARALEDAGLPHRLLNAKAVEQEAEIIAGAGQRGAITIATNMAGRGVDIALGEGVAELGGLCVIGTARHEASRIDQQLRGRSGRQGDPGVSRFYLAADDELVRLFGGAGVPALMSRLPGDASAPLELPAITRAVLRAQRSVERQAAEARRDLLDYDEVLHRQRLSWFAERQRIVEGADLERQVDEWISAAAPAEGPDGATDQLGAAWRARRSEHPALHAAVERLVTLAILDRHWQAHLEAMEALRDGISLRSLAQENPVVAYALDAARLFDRMRVRAREEITEVLLGTRLLERPTPVTPSS